MCEILASWESAGAGADSSGAPAGLAAESAVASTAAGAAVVVCPGLGLGWMFTRGPGRSGRAPPAMLTRGLLAGTLR